MRLWNSWQRLVTPDDIRCTLDDYDGMQETGFGYLNSVDNFEQQLDQISYEEAVTNPVIML